MPAIFATGCHPESGGCLSIGPVGSLSCRRICCAALNGNKGVCLPSCSRCAGHASPFGVVRKTDQFAHPWVPLLHLADYLRGATQGLDHLLALLSPTGGVVTLLEQLVQLVSPVHICHEFLLHCLLCEPIEKSQQNSHADENKLYTYCTSVSMIALGTMSIIVRLTML